MSKSGVEVQLIGKDGNVFTVIGLVSAALKKEGRKDLANEFQAKAFGAASYDEVLTLCNEYVEIV